MEDDNEIDPFEQLREERKSKRNKPKGHRRVDVDPLTRKAKADYRRRKNSNFITEDDEEDDYDE